MLSLNTSVLVLLIIKFILSAFVLRRLWRALDFSLKSVCLWQKVNIRRGDSQSISWYSTSTVEQLFLMGIRWVHELFHDFRTIINFHFQINFDNNFYRNHIDCFCWIGNNSNWKLKQSKCHRELHRVVSREMQIIKSNKL